MNPKSSVKPGTVLIAPQVGGIDSARWRGFRQSAPFLTLLHSVMTDTTQLLAVSRLISPFRRASTLRNIPTRTQDFTQMNVGTQSLVIQIESLRMKLEFLMTDPKQG